MDNAQHQVVVAGGGVAGLEAIMALRALAGSRPAIRLVAPEPEFAYRPLSVGEPFGIVPPVRYPLEEVARDFDVELVNDSLESVDSRARRVKLASGAELGYDSLVVALGARPYPAWEHVATFGGSPDARRTGELVRAVERGDVGSLALVVPRGVTWPLPIYELALLTAARARLAGAQPRIAVFTPESDPLAIFGREASAVVAEALADAGVEVARGVTVDVTRDHDVVVPSEETPLRFEHVLAAPLLRGPSVAGLPADARGFIPIDGHCRVAGADGVFAAGDGTDFSVKQGGVAAQQGVAVAEAIAQRAGAPVEPRPFEPVLRARVLTANGSRFLHADAAPAGGVSEASDRPLWWPSHKIAAAHLGPYLATKGVLPEPAALVAREDDAGERLVPIVDWVEESPFGE